jgi:UDP-N-acetyl-D-glucosamine dehydrogenase
MTTATVVGLGKIGLPLAVQAAGAGVRTWGVDVNPAVVDLVAAGRPPFPGEPGLEERLAAVVGSGGLTPTLDCGSAVAGSDVVVVVVPLVVDASAAPDFRALDAATAAIAPALRPGTLVVYETTLPVGTTRHRLAPALAAGSGLELGTDLLVVHSPERVSSGSVFRDLRRYPKLVGGIDRPSAARAVAFYEEVLDFDDRPDLPRPNGVWDVGGAEAAELTKLAETTYRDLNIGFANELAGVAERLGVDIAEVIAAANSQPYSNLHTPGFVGGHCIPVYPWFLLAGAPELRLPRAAREVNDAMPAHVVDILDGAAGGLQGKRVAVLGLAYRGGVKETAFSGALALVEALRARGARPAVHDPLWSPQEIRDLGFEPYELGSPCDAAVVQADHAEYRTLGPSDLPGATAVHDVRRCTPAEGWGYVRRLVLGAPAPSPRA